VERPAVSDRAGTDATGGLHGFPVALTSFVGRALAVDQVAGQLGEYRLVTVTGPGGAGKTRLSSEVARRVAGRFADGVWLVELAAVRDPAQVAATVATALGIRDLPSVAAADALARALARRHVLLVLDNCEQVIGAVAELCGRLLACADDVRVLAASREPLRIAGETRYRLGPLTLPDPASPAAAGDGEAVTLFAERARQVEPGFALDEKTGPLVARLVTRLDGLPLAIELAAARVDVLGVAQLLDRIDDRFALLADADRLAPERHRSLTAAVQWSYQLLDDAERRVFRAVAAFPGPFTLDGAEAVAGDGASRAVLRLVECSLLLPPRTGPDGRSRYLMLETLRAYGAGLLAEAGENGEVMAAMVQYAAEVAEEASAGLYTRTGETDSLRRLDAEDITLRHALVWAMEHDPDTALRLALAQAPLWGIRGRLASQAPLLAAAAERAEVGSDQWCAARMRLGQAAISVGDPLTALTHYAAVRQALEDPGLSHPELGPVLLVLCLSAQSSALLQADRLAEADESARRALALAREVGLEGPEVVALTCLALVSWRADDQDGALRLVRQAQAISDEFAGGVDRGLSNFVTMTLIEAGDLAGAEQACAAGLAACRELGDLANLSGQLRNQTMLDLWTGRLDEAAVHLREQLQIATETGLHAALTASLDGCGYLCAATGRQAEAITAWAAMSALSRSWVPLLWTWNTRPRAELLGQARRQLGQAVTLAAQERGAAMTAATATEYALLLAATAPSAQPAAASGPALARLSPRERELLTLVAKGHTDAQIAAQLHITMRTVSSHLDRVRDKTGCRRRADLTRLALSAGLV
jgi:predicted ATPase/DNA-binding CsgD family transcriptional regulator